jgi:hypothetical protein
LCGSDPLRSLPHSGACNRAAHLCPVATEREKEKQAMPIVRKEPTIVKREVRLEQPVSDLLDDYARFIESRPDHVVNFVLKKTLARDRDYKRWKSHESRAQTASPATRKAGS